MASGFRPEMATTTGLDRLYDPSPAAARRAHLCPAAIRSGFTLCNLPTDGLAGRGRGEREAAAGLKLCVKCWRVADPPPRFCDLARLAPTA